MAKQPEKLFSCSKCGAQFLKWSGQCSECGAWGTVSEESVAIPNSARPTSKPGTVQPFVSLSSSAGSPAVPSTFELFDRFLSGGFVPGSVTLLGGEPGIGKSTLLAQLAIQIASTRPVLYVTGEESPTQVALRLKRLSPVLPPLLSFLDETDASVIASTIALHKPALTIVDSVQTIRLSSIPGEPGNPNQVKASAGTISEAAKKSGASVVLVGQVNKDGDLAGPRLLEHLVDTVAMLEGDRTHSLRVLRLQKHRFGPADQSFFLRMDEKGLEEVADPSAMLLADRPKNASGTIVGGLIEGGRPLLVELQVLVTPAGYGTPLRRTSGLDLNRLSLLLAVMGRRAGISFGDQDVFANIVGGFEAKDPGLDLAVCLAAASAKTDKPLGERVAAFGEIGLTGEIRPVRGIEQRIKEAQRLGCDTFIVPEKAKHLKDALRLAGLL